MSQISSVISLEETSSSSTEPTLICQNPIEESEQVASLPPLSLVNTQRSSSFSSDPLEVVNENLSDTQTAVESLSNSEPSNPTMVVVTSPSFNSDLSSEQNDSIDSLNPSSTSFLQTKQRRITHRRNKSEPFKSASAEDLSSTTNNDSPLSNNANDEIRRKSSTKMKPITQDKSPPSLTIRKKKAWYNPFQSTYRQRNEEFRKIFKDIPNDERFIVDYSCAWQKDILVQGRLYLSQNYLCFYANILNWKSILCLKFQDISHITREKTAKVISNAIEVKSNKGEKYFFASFVTRDKTHALISRLWQAVANNQPISTQDLWTMIHENYGDDLDVTTDEEDNQQKSSLNSTQILSDNKYDLSNIVLRITSNSIHSKSSQQEDDHSSISSRGENQTDDENIMPNGEELTRKEDMNITAENIERCYLTECLCQSHLATELINRTYCMSVERLFDCIFGNNDFLVAYRASRRIKDYHASEWEIDNETGKRERLCTYKVTVSAVFGSTTICSNERQVVYCELPKSHYIVDTEVRNEGIKYADSFFVASRYCLVQIGPNKSHLKVTCEVTYVKSLMAIIKTFIEKNAMAALQDSFTDLMKRVDQESSKQARNFNMNKEKGTGLQSHSVTDRRSSRQIQSDEFSSSLNDLSRNSQQEDEDLTPDQENSNFILSDPIFSSRNTFLIPFCIITMLLLLIVNIFLCIKLNQIDHMTDRLVQNYPSWFNRYSYQEEDIEWSSLLKQQEEYYRTQLISLQSILMTTHNALKNVTNALQQLSSGST